MAVVDNAGMRFSTVAKPPDLFRQPIWLGSFGPQPADLRPVLPFGLPAPALVLRFPFGFAFGARRRFASPLLGLSIGMVPATNSGDAT